MWLYKGYKTVTGIGLIGIENILGEEYIIRNELGEAVLKFASARRMDCVFQSGTWTRSGKKRSPCGRASPID